MKINEGIKSFQQCYDEWSKEEDNTVLKERLNDIKRWFNRIKDLPSFETYSGDRKVDDYYYLIYANKITEFIVIQKLHLENKQI